jgi:hypothetical protein
MVFKKRMLGEGYFILYSIFTASAPDQFEIKPLSSNAAALI